MEEAIEYLKEKGLLKEGFTKFLIKGSFGEVDLVKMLEEYRERAKCKK